MVLITFVADEGPAMSNKKIILFPRQDVIQNRTQNLN